MPTEELFGQSAAPADDTQHDMAISRPHEPDVNWARQQPMFIQATKERLKKSHQIVSIRNTSDVTPSHRGVIAPQKHIVIDRNNQGHELQPGETRHDIDMLVTDIEFFLRERRPNRRDHAGRMKPLHPVEIVGFDPANVLEGDDPDEQAAEQRSPSNRRRLQQRG